MYCFVQFIILIALFGKIHNAAIKEKNLQQFNSYKLVRLAYKSFEPKNGIQDSTPIIFLHGITSTKEYWGQLPQTVADATGRKAYAVDSRNHGDTEWSDDFNFDVNAIDLELFMNNIRAPKAILIGHSMGGITAMKAALKWPHRVEKLIVEDMTTKRLPQGIFDAIVSFLSICQDALKVVPHGTSIESAQKMVMDAIIKALPESLKSLIKPSKDFRIPLKQNDDGSYSYKTNFKVLIEKLKDVNKVYPEISEGSYEGPACFIYGEKSPFQVGKDKELIKRFFNKAQFFGIKDASHGVRTDNPAEFTRLLLQFLKE